MTKTACMVLGVLSLTSCLLGETRMGPFGSFATCTEGSVAGVGVVYEWLSADGIGVDARLGYLTGSDADGDVIPIELGVVFAKDLDTVTLYGSVGGGYYIYQNVDPGNVRIGFGSWQYDLEWAGGDPDPTLGLFALAGVRFRLSDSVELFAEAKYTNAVWDMEDVYAGGSARFTNMLGGVEGGLDGVGGNVGIVWNL